MTEAARASGVNGVPFIIIDGKLAMNGVQPMDCYIQVSPSFCCLTPHNCPSADFPKAGRIIHVATHRKPGQGMQRLQGSNNRPCTISTMTASVL